MSKCLIIDSYGFIFRAFYVQPSLIAPDGRYVGAIYGFTSMLIKLLAEQKPTHVVAVFDTGGKNFRHEIFDSYKANRPPVPAELISQFPIAREVAKALNIKQLEQEGFEADDIIATLATKSVASGDKVIIVSADKDLAQLMGPSIEIYDPIKGKYIGPEEIYAKMGVQPLQIRDFLALTGDSSDNIPGVPGFGPKTAADLIAQFGNFHNICANYHHISSDRKRKLFEDNIEKAKLSYQLVGLISDIDIKFNSEDAQWHKPDKEKIRQFLDHYGFKSLHNRAYSICSKDESLQRSEEVKIIPHLQKDGLTQTLRILDIAKSFGYCGILKHHDNFIISCNSEVSIVEDKKYIIDLMASDYIQKITPSVKILFQDFAEINAYEDIGLMSYLLHAGFKEQTLEELFIKYTDIELPEDPRILSEEICKNIKLLRDTIKLELQNQNLLSLYLAIDLPISKILNKMERHGVLIDAEKLQAISEEFAIKLDEVNRQIFQIAGREFNINSPKQLGEVLFEDMNLPSVKKTSKTHSLSTNAEVLEDLANRGYDIAKHLLYSRQISKLKNTYTDALPKLINTSTNRLHTTFSQTSTTTGRLSSHTPNLQNIPVRTEEGAKIRNTIIAAKGAKLICADYSQVELRILAEIADIPELKDAFERNIDIHAQTASQIFGLALNEVTPDLRRSAKAINFGIIYGISSFGLATRLGIPQNEANKYIKRYLASYPGISKYMEKTKEYAKSNGFVTNALGRRCHLPKAMSSNHAERSLAERAAINAPIQGYASDIIKLAMIEIDKELQQGNFESKMILQIHDELIFECPEYEIEKIIPKIKNSMENIVTFNPRLKINIEISDFWS
ncbi:MAG: DNA polymerase I [Alphaproteobacteria bacterium]|nr:DNA polymerase I [Alphaproteobacteria bacterium]